MKSKTSNPFSARNPGALKYFLMFFAVFSIFFVSFPVKAYNSLSCWYSDGNAVAFWSYSPKYNCTVFGNDPVFSAKFPQAVSYAKDAWETVTTTVSYNSLSSNIPCYGGTRAEILAGTGKDMPESQLGVTVGSSTHYTYASYNGSLKEIKTQNSQQKVYIVKTGATYDYYQKVCLHEFGHAMGWLNHSTNPIDMMGGNSTNCNYLHVGEKNHLQQIYLLYP